MSDRITLLAQLMSELSLQGHPQSLINGKLCDGQGKAISLIDPFTKQMLVQYADAGSALAERACESAAKAQQVWTNEYNHHTRGLMMMEVARSISQHADQLAKIESLIAGKPINDCSVEVSHSGRNVLLLRRLDRQASW